MSIYVDLFHGRNTVDEEMDDWGFNGPILGPFEYIHYTYKDDIKLGVDISIKINSLPNKLQLPPYNNHDLIDFLGSLYGDMVIFTDITEREIILDRINRTKEIFEMPIKNIPKLLNNTEEWIHNFAQYVLSQRK